MYMRAYVCMYVYICMQAYVCMCTYVCMYVCLYMYLCTYVQSTDKPIKLVKVVVSADLSDCRCKVRENKKRN
jgi:hypothetical protein